MLQYKDVLDEEIIEFLGEEYSSLVGELPYNKNELRYAAKNAYSIVNHRLLTEIFQDHIEKLKQLKDIDINSQWINIDHEYQYDTDEGKVLIIFDTQNHLTALNRELIILINNNIIKDISTNDY